MLDSCFRPLYTCHAARVCNKKGQQADVPEWVMYWSSQGILQAHLCHDSLYESAATELG